MKNYQVVLLYISLILLILSFFIPAEINKEKSRYTFDIDYVNGHRKTIPLLLPNDISYQIESSMGGYYMKIYSHHKSIWGFNTLFPHPEACIMGVICVNSVTKY